MSEWNKGTLEFSCLGCNKVIAKEDASIRQGEKAVIFVYCNDCAKKLGMKK